MIRSLYFGILFICLTALLPGFAAAADEILVHGNDKIIPLHDNDDAYVDGTASGFKDQLSHSILTTKTSGTGSIAFSDIPYFSFTDTLYFQFIYDAQETGQGSKKEEIDIDQITISVNGGKTVVWDLDQEGEISLILNREAPFTATPTGNGADMALYIPVWLFNELGLLGSDLLFLTVSQTNADNGPDEWLVWGYGTFFGPDDPIHDPPLNPIPEPAAFILLGTGLVGVAGAARRKKKNQA